MLQLLTSDQALTNIREKGLMECILNINPMLSTSWVKRSLASTKGALKTCNKEWSRKFSMEADHRNQQYQCLRFPFLQCLLARLKWSRRLSWFRQALSPERQFLKPVIGCNSETDPDLELWGQGVACPARFSSIWEFFTQNKGRSPHWWLFTTEYLLEHWQVPDLVERTALVYCDLVITSVFLKTMWH